MDTGREGVVALSERFRGVPGREVCWIGDDMLSQSELMVRIDSGKPEDCDSRWGADGGMVVYVVVATIVALVVQGRVSLRVQIPSRRNKIAVVDRSDTSSYDKHDDLSSRLKITKHPLRRQGGTIGWVFAVGGHGETHTKRREDPKMRQKPLIG